MKAETCGKACYECLLDYFNQPDHQILDRYLVRDILAELAGSECKPAGGMGSRAERMVELRRRCDSKLEKRWLDLLDELVLRPPSDAQLLIEACSTRPDFFYREYNAAIYVDGPIHDEPDQIRADDEINQRLLLAGYIVVRFHHRADWPAIFRSHPDIFGVCSEPSHRESEAAVFTLLFRNPDDAVFTESQQEVCRSEGLAAIQSLLAAVDVPNGVVLTARLDGDGHSSYWIEILAITRTSA